MKIYLMAVLSVFVSSQAMACLESEDKKEERFKQYDANKDDYVDAQEWNKINSYGQFKETLKYRDKDGDKKLSKEEFLEISFVRGC
jgi:Ca2+-binding EF-hand superfamily protein